MQQTDDKINIAALSNGSIKDFDLLFTSYYPKVKSFLRSMLSDEEEAEDLAQDTFMRLWQSRESLGKVQNLNAYVYQTVKHLLYSAFEKKREIFMTALEGASEIASAERIEDIVYSHELEELLGKVIDSMPPQRKQVFCMSRKQGMTCEEISQSLGISKRTVEAHISMALSTLRKVISAFILFFNC